MWVVTCFNIKWLKNTFSLRYVSLLIIWSSKNNFMESNLVSLVKTRILIIVHQFSKWIGAINECTNGSMVGWPGAKELSFACMWCGCTCTLTTDLSLSLSPSINFTTTPLPHIVPCYGTFLSNLQSLSLRFWTYNLLPFFGFLGR